ncbi:alanyl-tRNA editing protein [Pseudalkalibacillus caeni]|uniref:Alanyl-tRNA editing protein n=1 Tax=Exobacillus caeni TaxID=2574798 RepID=A0A5R9F6Q9_9BACL|nr:alanyl-tRNA editing protein [Pseudalkalibacillus caeni]TLS36513.1 alanyl-tRNA editing protein [Pseudalkalibacillus caeni]
MAAELFLEDSYLKECNANIVEVEGNKVKLDQTVFYPTGGGQEHDTGFLVQNGREYEVSKVKKEKGDIVHYVKDPEGLEEGEVTAVIDWNRRYSLMKHHSLLHVLASVFNKEYGSLCTGNQIYPDRARIDLTEIHSLEKEDLDRIVEQANNEIHANHPISSRVLPREEAEQISGAIKTVVNLIPAFVKDIRLVKIGEIDEQACGGTHIGETKEIEGVVLDKVKNKGKGVTRLEVRATAG